MTDTPFTNREINAMFEHVNEKLDKILEQTTKTNGRVNKLESWRDELKGAGKLVKVAWSFFAVFVVSTIYALFNMYIQFQTIDEKINNAVASQLDKAFTIEKYEN